MKLKKKERLIEKEYGIIEETYHLSAAWRLWTRYNQGNVSTRKWARIWRRQSGWNDGTYSHYPGEKSL